MMFGILWYSSCGVEGLTEESCMVVEIMALLRVAWCPKSGPDLLNQFALEGWSRVFRVLGPTPDTLKRCGGASRGNPQLGRAPTPELEEGCLGDVPGGGCPRIFTPRAPTSELSTTGRDVFAQ